VYGSNCRELTSIVAGVKASGSETDRNCMFHTPCSVPLATPVLKCLGNIGVHMGELRVFGTRIQSHAGELRERRCARLDIFQDGIEVSILENVRECVGSPPLPKDVSIYIQIRRVLGGDPFLSGAGV
jgi:hypothetical protein